MSEIKTFLSKEIRSLRNHLEKMAQLADKRADQLSEIESDWTKGSWYQDRARLHREKVQQLERSWKNQAEKLDEFLKGEIVPSEYYGFDPLDHFESRQMKAEWAYTRRLEKGNAQALNLEELEGGITRLEGWEDYEKSRAIEILKDLMKV